MEKMFLNAVYMDKTKTVKERVDDLLSKMTIEEKVAQLGCMVIVQDDVPDMERNLKNGIGEIADNISQKEAVLNLRTTQKIQHFLVENTRLGIPALIHCEALQGATQAQATTFPGAIGLAATWNPDTVEDMGEVIRNQCKAMGVRQILSPVMDICRDARWGRINETYGESPTLGAAMSVAFTKGVQGDDLTQGVVCTAKHFIGYGASEGGCNMHACNIPPRTLREVYAKPFQAAITEAGLGSVMNSYCTVDGEAIVGSKNLLTGLLRDEMKFHGIVVSDYMSLERLINPLNAAGDMEDAACKALSAGMDVECPNFVGYAEPLKNAIKKNPEKIMPYVDISVRRVLETKFLLGLFDQPYTEEKAIEDSYGVAEYEDRSVIAAEQSMTLVKNEDKSLPLSKALRKIAVIGPLADDIRALFSAYTLPAQMELHASRKPYREGTQMAGEGLISEEITPHSENVIVGEDPCTNEHMKEMYPMTESVLEALKRLYPDIEFVYAKGCKDVQGGDESGFEEAVAAAREADAVILTIGGRNGWGKKNTVGEALDSCHLELTGLQPQLAKVIMEANERTIVVHMNGRPLSDQYIDEHAKAILEAWCPGPYGAQAIAKTLFGDLNPGGKMPITTPRYVGQVPVYAEHSQGSGYDPKRGLVLNHKGYFDGTNRPLRYFGQGLSYTSFQYSDLTIDKKKMEGNDTLIFSVKVTNTGDRAGDEVVQVYVRDLLASMARPVKELIGFKRIHLQPGETQKITFKMPLSQIAFLDTDMNWKVEAGEMRLMVGSSSEEICLAEEFEITTDAYTEGATRGFYALAEVE